jgi:hypothetical protein
VRHVALRIGSLETVIEELFDTIGERLRRVLALAARWFREGHGRSSTRASTHSPDAPWSAQA